MHPVAPGNYNDLVHALEQSMNSIVDLGLTCSPEAFARATDCPGWSVKDVFAHVVGAEKSLAVGVFPDVEVPDAPHLRHDAARLIERDVVARRDVPGPEIVAELAEYLPVRMAELRSADNDPDAVVGGYFGPDTTLGLQTTLRTIDAWVHEQDIRGALDRPGGLDSPAAAVFTASILSQLGRIVSRVAGIEPGNAVILDVTGPVTAREGVRVVTGEDGRPRGEALFSGTVDEASHDPHLPETVTTIQLSTDALTRRAAGRKTTDEIHTQIHGDEDVARRVLDALVITP